MIMIRSRRSEPRSAAKQNLNDYVARASKDLFTGASRLAKPDEAVKKIRSQAGGGAVVSAITCLQRGYSARVYFPKEPQWSALT
jgi:hypothetical protein